MTQIIQRTRNTNDTANIVSITLNANTSTTISAVNLRRINFTVSNDGVLDAIVKLQAASVDDLKIGIPLLAGDTYEMPWDNIYTGEISAIAKNADVDVFVTEY